MSLIASALFTTKPYTCFSSIVKDVYTEQAYKNGYAHVHIYLHTDTYICPHIDTHAQVQKHVHKISLVFISHSTVNNWHVADCLEYLHSEPLEPVSNLTKVHLSTK